MLVRLDGPRRSMVVKTRDLSESGFSVFIDPPPAVGDMMCATLNLGRLGCVSLAMRVKYQIPDVGVGLEVVADGCEPGSVSRYLELARSLLGLGPPNAIQEDEQPVSFERRMLKEVAMSGESRDATGRASWGPLSVSRRPSEEPPAFQKGGVIELLYEAWTPFNGIVEQHLADLVTAGFTEERVYALDGTPRAVKFLQTVDLAVLDPESLEENAGVPFFDGAHVGVLFIDDDNGPSMRALHRGILIRLSNRKTPYVFEDEASPR
ncbi:MAG: hypothetical protein HYV07_25580 [Deltaproteobacteria bacterium]|nr:hypothetical protein [Deltaproteobacteria bacterium]